MYPDEWHGADLRRIKSQVFAVQSFSNYATASLRGMMSPPQDDSPSAAKGGLALCRAPLDGVEKLLEGVDHEQHILKPVDVEVLRCDGVE